MQILGHEGLMWDCPGCNEGHMVYVKGDGVPLWDWNGDFECPTFSPSVLVQSVQRLTAEEVAVVRRGEANDFASRKTQCHFFITNGRIQFLDDCTHALKGQTINMANDDD